MKFRSSKVILAAAGLAAAVCVGGTASADPLATPAMAGPLTSDGTPLSFDGGFGTLYAGAALTGLAFYQSNASHAYPGDTATGFDLSNGQVWLEKNDGLIQFYVQGGIYSIPSVGASYVRSSQLTSHTFGSVAEGYVKIAPSDSFSVEIGKLPTLLGSEYTFTFQNMNIERGLLWNQEPAISRGVQANYASGPLTISVSWNDGYYSNRYDTLSGLISYAFNSANTLAFAGSGNLGKSNAASFATNFILNNSQIYDLMYTYTAAPWTVSPYVQYQNIDKRSSFFPIVASMSDWGFGLLANYNFTPTFNLAGRAEYETSSGGISGFETPLPYGAGSKVFSLTLTPTWQIKQFFVRGEASYTSLSHAAPGLEFGKSFDKSDQFRLMVETGVLL
jgi:hypothetical protein